MTMVLDQRNEEFHDDPYPLYRQVRDRTPVMFYEPMNSWLVTRYEDANLCLRSPKLFTRNTFWDAPTSRHDPADDRQAYVIESFSQIMMMKDGGDHTRMRRLSGLTFSPRKIRSGRDAVERICRELLTMCREKGDFDWAHDFANLLPSLVIADYIGIPVSDRETVRVLADRLALIFEPRLSDPERFGMLVEVSGLAALLDELIDQRRAEPQEDFISLLVSRDRESGGMSPEEVRGNLLHFLVAGNETTTNLLCHMAVVLDSHPEVADRVRADSGLVPAWVEETLRLEAPIVSTLRRLAEDTEIGGRSLRAGDLVRIVLASANHDERRFSRPDEFDLDRPDNQHLSLGVGPHFCIGAPLARLEAAVAGELLTSEFSDLRLIPGGTRERKPDDILRGYLRLDAAATT